MRYAIALCWLLTAALSPPAAAARPQAVASAPVPDNARAIDRSHRDSATYPLITARINQRGGIKGNISSTRTVEGALSRYTYRLPSARKAKPAATAYVHKLKKAGFKIMYACVADACGATFVRASPGYRAHPHLFDVPRARQRYTAARLPGNDGDTYIAVQTTTTDTGVAMQIDRLRVKPRRIGAITVSAAQMASDLATKGRVALYGIFFATNSDGIKPESKATLGEIAKLMASKPKLRLLVVGHTDSTGAFDYNIDLSKRRARSVVDALVNDYGVDRHRLKPWGVGYTAPRATNKSDIGKAKNRRVELVPW